MRQTGTRFEWYNQAKTTNVILDPHRSIDREPLFYACRMKDLLHPNNINRESWIEILGAWIPLIRGTTEVTSSYQSQPCTSKLSTTVDAHSIDLIARSRLEVCSWDVVIHIHRDRITNQKIRIAFWKCYLPPWQKKIILQYKVVKLYMVQLAKIVQLFKMVLQD